MHHNNFFVYTHTRHDTNEVFYVGMGTTSPPHKVWKHNTKYSRAYEKTKRSDFWKNVTSKTTYTVTIVYESSNLESVKNKEIELIAFYGRRCCDTNGSLVNFSSGGDRADNPRAFNIRVTQRDIKTNDIIKIWDQLKDIETQCGYLKTNIVKCCRKKQLTAYGYYWEYTDDKSYDSVKATAARKKNSNRGVGINVFTKEGILYKTFSTQDEAAKYFNLSRDTIYKYLSNKYNRKHSYFEFKYATWNK